MARSVDGERVITAKHAGACRLCGRPVRPGDEVWWSPLTGTRCRDDQVGENVCMGEQEGDPPPRDWGDL